ncbi:MAG TPA: HD domain-containing phosphohydrolase, partial [Patescibacteria group bacterium]|nr:HD domain-containing phosphohydrolase [Patescibacteria group bacterium]
VDTFIRATTRGRPLREQARVIAYTLVRGEAWGRRYAAARCEVGRETARRLGLSEGVRRGLHEMAEGWNGKGGILGLRGDDISLPARIANVAAVASRFDDIGGEAAAVEAIRRRAGRSLDPSLAAAFEPAAGEILQQVRATDPRDALLEEEPPPVRVVSEAGVAEVAAAIGDIADLKSTFTLGHSAAVADLAVRAADDAGLDEAAVGRLRVASLLHDLGRVGISTGIWERPGPLTGAEWEQVRLHPYHSERVLARSETLRPVAEIAGMHHERLDGSGYHRGSAGRAIPAEARLLGAADAFHAMTEERPHRRALQPAQAAERLQAEARGGRLDADAVSSLIHAAGLAVTRPRVPSRPAGLSEREVEVLRLVARGLSNRDIADRLVVSRRTAEHHVQHIYDKIGVSSRAAAALFAMEHALLD